MPPSIFRYYILSEGASKELFIHNVNTSEREITLIEN